MAKSTMKEEGGGWSVLEAVGGLMGVRSGGDGNRESLCEVFKGKEGWVGGRERSRENVYACAFE